MNKHLESGRRQGADLKFVMPDRISRGHAGDRTGFRTGSSQEFLDYREYTPGDDLRRIDWRAYARTDRLLLKVFHDEIRPVVNIVSDMSASMDVYHGKSDGALFVSGLLAESAFQAGASVSWCGFGNGWRNFFPLSQGFPEHIGPDMKFDGAGSFAEEFSNGDIPFIPRNDTRICVSDFLWDAVPEESIGKIAENASDAALVMVLADEELSPSLSGPCSLADPESEGRLDMFVSTREIDSYLARLKTHITMWEEASLRASVKFCLLRAAPGAYPDIRPLVEAGIIDWQ